MHRVVQRRWESLLTFGPVVPFPAGVVSAPLYDSTTQRFAGMFTLADVVHLIQYYYLTAHEYENVVAEVEAFQLESLRSAPWGPSEFQ